jgi:gliding motility-associated-like protein
MKPVFYTLLLTFMFTAAFAQSRSSLPLPDSVSVDSASALAGMANVFTPNKDGVNDVFTISGKGLQTVELKIFDRWGTLIYDFFGPNDQWDGRNASGAECQPGVYFYFLKATGVDGQSYGSKGTIQLLR